MILSGNMIRESILDGEIVIEDYDESRLNPNSYNLRLGNRFLTYDELTLDPKMENRHRITEYGFGDAIKLQPGILYLAETMEYTETYRHVPMIEGRSSIGRLGVFVHVTAGFGDLGFCGRWTLEITVVQPVYLYVGMEICQIFYHQIFCPGAKYNGRYQGATGVEGSKLYES